MDAKEQHHRDLITLKDVLLPRFAQAIFQDIIAPVPHPAGNIRTLAPNERYADYSKPLWSDSWWEDGQIVYQFRPRWADGNRHENCFLNIRNLRLVDVDDIEIGTTDITPGDTGSDSDERLLDEVFNDNETPLPTTIDFERLIEEEESKSKETEWGVAASLEVKRSIEASAGIEGIGEAKSTTEITARVESHLNQTMSQTNRKLSALRNAKSRTYTAAPFTHLKVVQESTVRDVRMDIYMRGRLECTMFWWSQDPHTGDQQTRCEVPNIDELERLVRGELADKYEWFSRHYSRRENRWSSADIENKLHRPVLTMNIPIEGQEVTASKIASRRTLLPGHPQYQEDSESGD